MQLASLGLKLTGKGIEKILDSTIRCTFPTIIFCPEGLSIKIITYLINSKESWFKFLISEYEIWLICFPAHLLHLSGKQLVDWITQISAHNHLSKPLLSNTSIKIWDRSLTHGWLDWRLKCNDLIKEKAWNFDPNLFSLTNKVQVKIILFT